MKTLFRVLGAAAAVAVTGAAIVVLDKVLNDKDPLHVENVEFPEEAEKDPAEAEKTAEAYAEGEAKETAPGDAWPPAFEKAPAEPETALAGCCRSPRPCTRVPWQAPKPPKPCGNDPDRKRTLCPAAQRPFIALLSSCSRIPLRCR